MHHSSAVPSTKSSVTNHTPSSGGRDQSSKKCSSEISSPAASQKHNKTDPLALFDNMVKTDAKNAGKCIEAHECMNMAKLKLHECMHRETLESSTRKQEMVLAAERECIQDMNKLVAFMVHNLGSQNHDSPAPGHSFSFPLPSNTLPDLQGQFGDFSSFGDNGTLYPG